MSTTTEKVASQQPDDAKDRQAARLRAEGMSFREIADVMGTDVAMVHRRVRRAAIQTQRENELRMQKMRDDDLDKLRRMERAILSDAFHGDREALRLVLRIMRMRHRLLSEMPEDTTDVPAPSEPIETPTTAPQTTAPPTTAPQTTAPAAGSTPTNKNIAEPRDEEFSAVLERVLSQPKSAQDVAPISRGSTTPSTQASTPTSTPSATRQSIRRAKRKAAREAKRNAQPSIEALLSNGV